MALCGPALLEPTAPARAATGPAAVRLRYAMKPGSVFEQATLVVLNLKISPEGVPEALMALIQSMAGDMKQNLEMKGELKAGDRGADGRQAVTFRIVDAKATLVRAGEVKDLPSVAAAGGRPPIKGRVTADGRGIELDSETGKDAMSPRLRDRIAEALPTLPEKALKVGDSFEVKVPMTLPAPGGQGESRIEATWTYTLLQFDGAAAQFAVKQVLPETAALGLKDGRSVTLAGSATGTATFSLSEGLFTAMAMDTDFDMVVGMPSPPVAAGENGAAPAEPPAPLMLKTTVKGPVTMKMTRTQPPGTPPR